MADSQDPAVVTARRLTDGAPVFLTAKGEWSTALGDAAAYAKDVAAQHAKERGEREQHLVCDPYTFPVKVEAGEVLPLSSRERIRSQGPTVPIRRPD